MCGINGALTFANGTFRVTDRYISRMRDTMTHRGPDDAATWVDAAGRWQLTVPPGLDISIRPAAYSPSYGVKEPCSAIDISSHVDLRGEGAFEFVLTA